MDLKNRLHQIISDLTANAATMSLKKGQSFYLAGDSPSGVFFIQEGLVGLMQSSLQGSDSLLRVFKEQQVFGHRSFFANENYHLSAIALDDTKYIKIDREQIHSYFSKSPDKYLVVIQILARELRRAEQRSLVLSEGNIIERVAYTLLLFKKLYADRLWTRTEIANFCGSRTPTVITALGELENMSIIRQQRREIEVIDEEALVKLVFHFANEV